MSYAPPPGPHGGIPHQQQQPWGAAPSPPPYRGPAAPRKFLVAIVGLALVVAVLSTFSFYVLWSDNLTKETGIGNVDDLKDLPGPRGLGPLTPGPISPSSGGGA